MAEVPEEYSSMPRLTDREFGEFLDYGTSRRELKSWKRDYYAKERTETPKEFYYRISDLCSMLNETELLG